MMNLKRILTGTGLFLAFCAVGWLSFMRPDWVLLFGGLTIIAGYFLLFICFTPIGALPLGKAAQKTPLPIWFGKLLQAQGIMLLLTLAAGFAFLGNGPGYAQGDITVDFVEDILRDKMLWQWGIFPWSVFGLWGIMIAYVTYNKRGAPYIYQIMRNICPKFLQPAIKSFCEGILNGATITAFTLSLCTVILLLAYCLEKWFKLDHFAVPVITVTVLSFVSPLFLLKPGRHFFARLAAKKITLSGLFNFFVLVWVAALLIAALGNAWVIHKYPQLYAQGQCQQCHSFFANVPASVRFAALYWGWWLTWVPLGGSYLAKISQGRTLREWILGLFIVPAVFLGIYLLWGSLPIVWIMSVFKHIPVPLLPLVLSLLIWIVCYCIFRGISNSDLFYSGVMPLDPHLQHNRLWLKDGSKTWGISKYGPRFMINIAGVLFLHTMGGWYGIQFQLAAMGVLVIDVIYCSFCFLLFQWFKDKAWSKPQTIPPFQG